MIIYRGKKSITVVPWEREEKDEERRKMFQIAAGKGPVWGLVEDSDDYGVVVPHSSLNYEEREAISNALNSR